MGQPSRFSVRVLRCPFLAAVALIFLAMLLPAGASAQIVINELYPNPPGTTELEERVEIYNAGATPIDVTGWAIEDAATIDMAAVRCRLPEDFDTAACPGGAIIQPGEFRLVKGQLAQAWLNNTGDVVYLATNRTLPAITVDVVSYPSASLQEGRVWSAIPNGTENFDWRDTTLCATNGGTGDVVAPGTVSNLAAAPGAYPGEIRLTWTAPGDDGTSGTASAYEIRFSYGAINAGNFDAAMDLERRINEPLPLVGGAPETLFVFGFSPDTTYYFALKTLDEVPNTSGVSNSPSSAARTGSMINPNLGYSVYYGNLHSHTSYSDGVQTPAQAFAYARNTAQTPLDFLAVTDHNHSTAGMSLPNYHLGRSEAIAANSDGNFVAIYGQEWGLAANGHINIFESPALFGWESGNYDVFVAEGDYAGLYTAALANPPVGYPVLAEWCHPALGDFNSFQVTGDGQAVTHLMCLVNGPAQSTATDESDVGNTGFDASFQEALRKGMRVSPTADQDNHLATWGASSESRTAVLAPAKTKAAIFSALAARRNYATQDHNVRVDFSAEGHAMGEAFSAATGIRIATQVTDPDVGESVAIIELFRGVTGTSLASRVAWNTGSPSLHWRELDSFSPLTEVHYYLRIRMADNQAIWTGPIYVTYDPSAPTAVGDRRPSSLLALAASPNPARGPVHASFVLPRASRATLAVYDASGRRVRILLERSLEAGEHRAVWDGFGDNGKLAHTGVFFLRLDTTLGSAARKIVFLQ